MSRDGGRWGGPAAVITFPIMCDNTTITRRTTWPHAESDVGGMLSFSRTVLVAVNWGRCPEAAVSLRSACGAARRGAAVSPASVVHGSGGLCGTREGHCNACAEAGG